MVWTLTATLDNLPPWWQRIDDNPKWQDGAFIGLAACYGLIALVAVVQLIRIQRRVPEYGWTTQKVSPFLASCMRSEQATPGLDTTQSIMKFMNNCAVAKQQYLWRVQLAHANDAACSSP